MNRLKEKWGIESNVRFAIILLVFSVAGSLTIFIRKPVFNLLNLEDASFLLKALVYLLTVTPSYFIILLVLGTISGQFKFFWAFEKKMLSRFKRKA